MITMTSVEKQALYFEAEQEIIANMERFMNSKPFHYLNIDPSISEGDRIEKNKIVTTLTSLVSDIRSKNKEASAFFDYQDLHFDEPDHVWLQEQHPGVNVSGWRVVMILMDPMKYGVNLDRPMPKVSATISKRSAKN